MAFKLTDFNKLAAKYDLYLTKYYGYFAWGFTDSYRYEREEFTWDDVPPCVCVKHFNHLKKENWMLELKRAIEHLKKEQY